MLRAIWIGMLAVLLASSAFATSAPPPPPPPPLPLLPSSSGCIQESATTTANFTLKGTSFAEARADFDKKMKQMDDFANEQHLGKMTLQTMNYNVNSQQNGTETIYQLSGRASYGMQSADDAFKLAEFFNKQ